MADAAFGDTVRIGDAPETRSGGFAGREGVVFGETLPSSSGAGPVIGDRGEDYALSVFFEDTREQHWFAPHLVEFVDHAGAQQMSLQGGPTFVRRDDGSWEQLGGPSPEGSVLSPGGPIPRVVPAPGGRIRRWLRRYQRR